MRGGLSPQSARPLARSGPLMESVELGIDTSRPDPSLHRRFSSPEGHPQHHLHVPDGQSFLSPSNRASCTPTPLLPRFPWKTYIFRETRPVDLVPWHLNWIFAQGSKELSLHDTARLTTQWFTR